MGLQTPVTVFPALPEGQFQALKRDCSCGMAANKLEVKVEKICKQGDAKGLIEQRYHQEQQSSSDSTLSLGESAVWVGDEMDPPSNRPDADRRKLVASNYTVDSESRRKSQDASSASSHTYGKDTGQQAHATLPDNQVQIRTAITKDTHFYHTIVAYRDHHLPIKLPLSTFPEEVGDVRLVSCPM